MMEDLEIIIFVFGFGLVIPMILDYIFDER